jgi:hypothetical protein
VILNTTFQRAFPSAAATIAGAPVLANSALPSGQNVELHEVIVEQVNGQTIARFRFIAPEISRTTGTVHFTDAEPDMVKFCVKLLPCHTLPNNEVSAPESVVISLADRDC